MRSSEEIVAEALTDISKEERQDTCTEVKIMLKDLLHSFVMKFHDDEEFKNYCYKFIQDCIDDPEGMITDCDAFVDEVADALFAKAETIINEQSED